MAHLMEPDDDPSRVTSVQTTKTAPHDEVAAVYARGCASLIGLLTSIGGSRSEAEEVAQDAYVKLLERWGRVRYYDDPDAWVRQVAVRLLISRYRRAKVASLGLRRLASYAREQHPDLSADAVATSAALEALPVSHRAVVILHHVMDLPVEQVARELHIPVGTVKSRLARARNALIPLLSEFEGSDNA